jgi:hypothetical protein
MKHLVKVNTVIIGSDFDKTCVAMMHEGKWTLPERQLKEKDNDFDISEIIEGFDPNLVFVHKTGFLVADKEVHLIYRIMVPLSTRLKDDWVWRSGEEINSTKEDTLPNQIKIINTAMEYGQNTHSA